MNEKEPEKRAPKNTTNRHPAQFLIDISECGNKPQEAILREERIGQHSLIHSDTLPTELDPTEAKLVLEKDGVKFLGPVEGDPLFQYVELPPGWKKVSTSHGMLSMLVDDKNRERARLFYKAGSYDRKSALILVPRYGIHEQCYNLARLNEPEFVAFVTDGGVVTDSGKTIHITKAATLQGDKKERFRATQQVIKQAKAWLDSNYPDWRNPLAYWD